MLTEALFAVAKMWLSIDQGMDKENVVYIYIHIHTREYYSATKRIKFCHLQQHEWT